MFHEYAFNRIMAIPFGEYDDVLGVTGHCADDNGRGGIDMHFIGRCGTLVDDPLTRLLNRTQVLYGNAMTPAAFLSAFHVRDYAARPLLLHRARTEQMGRLDDTHFVLGDDDFDLAIRAYAAHEWVVGLVAVDYTMRLHDGARRHARPPAVEQLLDVRRHLAPTRDSWLDRLRGRTRLHSESRPLVHRATASSPLLAQHLSYYNCT